MGFLKNLNFLAVMNAVIEYVFPALAGLACGAVAFAAVAFAVAFTGYGGGVWLPRLEALMAICGMITLTASGCMLMIALCLFAWAAAEATGEWLVMRSPLYQRAEREVQFWMDAHGALYEEYAKLIRDKAKQEQPQVEVVTAPANDYW